MRVLFVTLAFDPGHVSPFPGVNRYSTELARALSLEGIRLTIATPLEEPLPPKETWQGIEIFRLPDSKTYMGRPGVLAEANLMTFALNLRLHPELYQGADVLYTNVPLFPVEKSWPQLPVVYFLHHRFRFWQGRDLLTVPFGFYYEHRTLKIADRVIVPSMATCRDVLRQHHIAGDKVVVVNHGVDKRLFKPMGVTGGRRPGLDVWLMYTGLLDLRKGVADLVPIFLSVNRKRPEARLLIVGSGPGESELKDRFKWVGLQGKVRFARNVSDQELAQYLNSASVFLFPSRLEGFGFAPVEAMACGKPVVAYSTPVNKEIIGEAGVLVPEGDLGSFADGVEELLRDPSYAQRIGMAARQRVEQSFDWRFAAQKHVEVFNEVCRKDV